MPYSQNKAKIHHKSTVTPPPARRSWRVTSPIPHIHNILLIHSKSGILANARMPCTPAPPMDCLNNAISRADKIDVDLYVSGCMTDQGVARARIVMLVAPDLANTRVPRLQTVKSGGLPDRRRFYEKTSTNISIPCTVCREIRGTTEKHALIWVSGISRCSGVTLN